MAGIWVYAEYKDGKVKKVAFDILSEAKQMANVPNAQVYHPIFYILLGVIFGLVSVDSIKI